MRRTNLIQRLMKPRVSKEGVISQAMDGLAFGGGMRNGGLSPEAMDLLRPIFGFDYMGSAEFEFGAVPESFSNMAKNISLYGAYEFKVGGHTVYLMCKGEDVDEIKETIKSIYKDEHRVGLKEYPRLKDSLKGGEFHKDIIGWLELDNDFLFFKDKEAFDKVKALFAED